MSHDFEPTEAEKEMLSHIKDIEVNRKQSELGNIISGAILDGQNQIHDLYKEKATAQEVEYRMCRSYTYWMNKLHQELQKARHDWLREEIVKLEGVKMANEHSSECLHNEAPEYCDCDNYIKWNKALQTIIDRYQSELDQPK